jgi:monoamine oxidase
VVIEKYIDSIERNLKESISEIVRYNSEVIEVDNIHQDFTIVTCIDRTTGKPLKLVCKKVICAVPLQVLRSINFTNISENKRIVFDNQLRTNALKTFVIFKKPFWRNKGKTGDGLFSYDWLLNMCHDISP